MDIYIYIASVDHNQFASSMDAYKTTQKLRKLYCDKVDIIWLWSSDVRFKTSTQISGVDFLYSCTVYRFDASLSTQPHSKTNTDLHSVLQTFHVLNRIYHTQTYVNVTLCRARLVKRRQYLCPGSVPRE